MKIRNTYLKAWRKRSKVQIALSCKKWLLKAKYKLSIEEYNKLILSQNNKCLICLVEFTEYKKDRSGVACVDHCHKTGKVRGLLCHRCNTSLGFLREDTERIWNMIEYIKKDDYASF